MDQFQILSDTVDTHHGLLSSDWLVPLSGPSNLRVSDEWYNRFRVTWDAPQFPTMGYRVIYQPVSGM